MARKTKVRKQGGDGVTADPQKLGMPEAAYAVGYRKPPVHSRFKPGQTGNRKGRPKGARSLKSLIQHALEEKVAVKTNGKSDKATKRQVIATQIVNQAVRGDTKATKFVMDLEEPVTAAEGADGDSVEVLGATIKDADLQVLEHALQRIQRGASDQPSQEGENSE